MTLSVPSVLQAASRPARPPKSGCGRRRGGVDRGSRRRCGRAGCCGRALGARAARGAGGHEGCGQEDRHHENGFAHCACSFRLWVRHLKLAITRSRRLDSYQTGSKPSGQQGTCGAPFGTLWRGRTVDTCAVSLRAPARSRCRPALAVALAPLLCLSQRPRTAPTARLPPLPAGPRRHGRAGDRGDRALLAVHPRHAPRLRARRSGGWRRSSARRPPASGGAACTSPTSAGRAPARPPPAPSPFRAPSAGSPTRARSCPTGSSTPTTRGRTTPSNPYTYNVFQTADASWRSYGSYVERLWSYGRQYRYVAVLDYNLPEGPIRTGPDGIRRSAEPADTRAGGGIFLHVTDGRSTAGCIAIPEGDDAVGAAVAGPEPQARHRRSVRRPPSPGCDGSAVELTEPARVEPIAQPGSREQVARARRIGLDLAAQLARRTRAGSCSVSRIPAPTPPAAGPPPRPAGRWRRRASRGRPTRSA